MCGESEFVGSKNPCECETQMDDKLNKRELLIRLREHKKYLESELNTVNKNLEKRPLPRKEVTDHD